MSPITFVRCCGTRVRVTEPIIRLTSSSSLFYLISGRFNSLLCNSIMCFRYVIAVFPWTRCSGTGLKSATSSANLPMPGPTSHRFQRLVWMPMTGAISDMKMVISKWVTTLPVWYAVICMGKVWTMQMRRILSLSRLLIQLPLS